MSTAKAITTSPNTLLSDPEFIWEAMSIEGVSYPFDDSRYNKTKALREEIQGMVNEYDRVMALHIGELVSMGDDAELGRLVREQIEAHAIKVTEAA